jgi:predicted dehydrogenase
MEHRLPVICEKPLAMNGAEARRMVEAASKAGVPFGVAQVFRFEESVAVFRERIDRGDIGRPLVARAEFHYPGSMSPRKWINDPNLACGGPIADVGVHCLDVLRYILDDEVSRASTAAIADEASGPFEASAILVLEFTSGLLASIAVSTRRSYRTYLEVVGNEGSIAALDALNVEVPITIELQRDDSSEPERFEVSNQDAYTRQVDAFVESVEGRTAFPVPGDEGLRNQLVLDALLRSRESGRAEPVQQV